MPTTFTSIQRRVTGLSGIAGGVVSVLMVALYFVYSGPPPLANVLGRNLITVATFTGFLIFSVGLSRMLRASRHGDPGLSGALAVTALQAYVVVTLVSASLETGTSLWYPDGSLDPTVDGPLASAVVLLHGPIARVLVATYLIALSIATRNGIFSARVRRCSIILAAANLALVPSLFFGMDAASFYAANGWGSVALIGLINVIWFGVLGRAVLKTGVTAASSGERIHSLTR
ncbi:hypothetical protein B0E53_00971 [Micromonospora sp. MH33]|uniref:hypothetical protein n=1 Tax=Micromonospora sp. MH33 TaxID=1945509 RepID=UPI000D149E30|nr:hypothetical protein [Micromonospora sp. MH33]PSK67066.1 hypothetical protein B0E53_00971 [Micromonospora sp. MH33]